MVLWYYVGVLGKSSIWAGSDRLKEAEVKGWREVAGMCFLSMFLCASMEWSLGRQNPGLESGSEEPLWGSFSYDIMVFGIRYVQ